MPDYRNNYLIFQNVWNTVVCTTSPTEIKENLMHVLADSKIESLFNEKKLYSKDELELEDICRDLDILADNIELIKSRITSIALKYKGNQYNDKS